MNPWGKELKIEIYGGLGVKIVIKNSGDRIISNIISGVKRVGIWRNKEWKNTIIETE